jgi:hypothetical protein
MTADHSSYEELASARRGTPDYREGYAEAQRAYLIGQAVRDRRPHFASANAALSPAVSGSVRLQRWPGS